MSWLFDVWDALRGRPGHLGKAKIEDQKIFHWPFVTLTNVGAGKWKLEVYFEPNFPRSSTAKWPTIHLSLMSLKNILRRATEENRRAAERWAKKKKTQRQDEHNEALKNRWSSGHTGHVSTCPVCQETKKKPNRAKGNP